MNVSLLLPFSAGLAPFVVWDVRWRRIPNGWVLPFLLSGVALRWWETGPSSAALGCAGVLLGAAVLLIPYALELCGGGDVKLLGAIGAWLGPEHVLYAAAAGVLLSAVIAVVLTAVHPDLRRDVVTNLVNTGLTGGMNKPIERKRAHSVPLGAALAAGAVLTAIYFGGLLNA